jgi:3'(2'), 5'-bisphosphate nucleotidase
MTRSDVFNSIDLGQYQGSKTGRFWTLDPIDGTKGFLRGGQYAVCLALIDNGHVQLGVIGCPNLTRNIHDESSGRGSMFIAVHGQGAFQRSLDSDKEHQIHVSPVESPSDTEFCESFEALHSAQDKAAKIAELLRISKPPVRMDSQCKYGVLARGEAGIYLRIPTRADYEEKIWDHASGSILMHEAGGRVTDIHGQELDFSVGRTLKLNKGIIATNGKLHSQVLEAVKSVL